MNFHFDLNVLCSYNALNGVPTCADKWLLQTVARDTWKFDGYVTSDCGAEGDVFDQHNFTKTPGEALKAIRATSPPGPLPLPASSYLHYA